jgi:hypothetical protein
VAERLLRPAGLLAVGRHVGAAAAEQAKTTAEPRDVHLPGTAAVRAVATDTREILSGIRSTARCRDTVPSAARLVPVLGRFDVVVIGGGTSGAPAAIGALRRGARVLVVEYQHGLGGTGTLGLIGRPYHGKRIGFSHEVPFPDKQHNLEHKMEWYRRQIRRAGGVIWFGAIGCGAVVEGGTVTGAVVATPSGRGVVLARVVVDATGNADVAVAAGADSFYGATENGDIAMQGAGIPHRPLLGSYVNTDYLFVDESDMVDVWRALVGTRQRMSEGVFDSGALIQTRERRRVVGDHVLRYLDQLLERTYPDSIALSASDYDSHGYPNHLFFALLPHDEKSRRANHPAPGGSCFTPYRCLLPRGLDGILVTGLGISMERDASAMIRMQLDLQNQGYAAGVAAAMAAESGVAPRDIDVKALQRHLVEIGSLPAEVLDHKDSFPLPREAVDQAARLLGSSDRKTAMKALAVVLAQSDTARPGLCRAFAASRGEARLRYAKILGVLGHAEAVPELIEALEGVSAWDEKIFQGKMAEYAHLPTPTDALILALGWSGDRRAVGPILRKLETLDEGITLSHHRAVALALERLADPTAAEPLARLLGKPGMSGHVMTTQEPLSMDVKQRRREGPLREIVLARALYRCGDWQGLGETTLRQYQADIRGLFARHAAMVLAAPTDESRFDRFELREEPGW